MTSEGVRDLRGAELVNKFTISVVKKSIVIYALPYGSGRP